MSAIIPAFNEEKTVAKTVRVALNAFPNGQVIVVDNASGDRTSEFARRTGAEVVAAPIMGKGRAMTAGLCQARGKVIVFFDADVTNAGQLMLKKLARPVMDGKCDLTIGSFSIEGPQLFTELAYRPFVRLFFPEVDCVIPLNPLSGQRAMLRSAAEALVFEPGFGVETGMNVDVVMKGLKVRQVGLGRLEPVHKGTLDPQVLSSRASEITATVLRKAKQYGRHSLSMHALETVFNGVKRSLH